MALVSIVTYNLYYSRAFTHACSLLMQERPDILCLQEVETDQKVLKDLNRGEYRLASYTNAFMKYQKNFGNAIVYNSDRYECLDVVSCDLPKGIYDLLMVVLHGLNNLRTTIHATFREKESGRIIHVYNVHLSHIGSATHRLNQLRKVLAEDLDNKSDNESVVVCGDFNFYSGRRHLQEFIDNHYLDEATKQLSYTFQHRKLGIPVMTSKLDYVLFRNLIHLDTNRLPSNVSDHFPIRSRFSLDRGHTR
ncbi:MAG: endonuclease/exonuclease/phosphatase family protein [Patescibacteria group bacterium]